MPDTLDIVVPSPGPSAAGEGFIPPPNDDSTGRTSFNEAMKAAGISTEEPGRITAEPKPEPKKEAEKKPPAPDEIPDAILHGVKPKEDKAPAEELDLSILDKRPEGQIKHDHFSKVQAIAKSEREQRVAMEKRVAEYEAKLKEPFVDETARTKLSEYEKGIKERDELLARIAYPETADFKRDFTDKEVALREKVSSTLKELGEDADVAAQLLAMGPKKRYEAIDNLSIPESAKAALTGRLEQLDDLNAAKQEALSKSQERLTGWKEEQKQAAQQEQDKRIEWEKKVFDEVGQKVAKEYEPFMPIPDNPTWEAGRMEREAEALKYLHGEKTWDELCEAVRYGVGAKFQHDKIVVPLRKALAERDATIAKLTANGPGLTPQQQAPKSDRKLSPELSAMETFRQEMAKASNNGFQP
jgi:hypothetical protein